MKRILVAIGSIAFALGYNEYSRVTSRPTESPGQTEIVVENTSDGRFNCPVCSDSFDTEHGRDIHKGRMH